MSDRGGESQRPRLSIAAPCYNEAEGIADLLEEWDGILNRFPFESEIVICNDGSTDASGVILKEAQSRYPRLRVVELERNSGYGQALCAALRSTRGEFIATIDSDGQFDLADAERLLAVAVEEGCELVTGYRSRKQDTAVRVLANHGLNLVVRALFGVKLRDTNCALKVARADVLRDLEIEASSWATPTEICLRVHALGFRIREVSVRHRNRVLGTSKVRTWNAAWGFLRYLIYMRLKLHLYRSDILNQP
ncbi:MAG: glycosyltransferase family 2 protein [Myxococcota bacterium]